MTPWMQAQFKQCVNSIAKFRKILITQTHCLCALYLAEVNEYEIKINKNEIKKGWNYICIGKLKFPTNHKHYQDPSKCVLSRWTFLFL